MSFSLRFTLLNIVLLVGFAFLYYDYLLDLIPDQKVIAQKRIVMQELKTKALLAQKSTILANDEYIDSILIYKYLEEYVNVFGLSAVVINKTQKGLRIVINGLLVNNLSFIRFLEKGKFKTMVEKLFISNNQSKLQVLIYENKKT